MGGLSQGQFFVNDDGNAIFQGDVSLANNGGFSMVRCRSEPISVRDYRACIIRLRGDGKRYQFRVKSTLAERHTYVAYFTTNGEWQEVEFPLSELSPIFRGRQLNIPDFPGKSLAEIGFLIGNKRAEPFRLELDWVRLVE